MKTLWPVLVGVCVALYGAGAGAQAEKEIQLDIQAQVLVDALNEWAQAAGFRLIGPASATRDLPSPRVKGTFTPRAALDRLLAGTSLTYEFVDEGTVAIREGLPTSLRSPSPITQGDTRSLRLAAAEGNERPSSSVGGVAKSDNQAAPSGSTQASDANKQRGALEEIIVTATKRTERLQDVPISIAVVTADDIDRRGLVSSEDYLRGMPGVNQTNNQFGQTIIIRGVETNSSGGQNFFGSATVATYFGETPTTSTQGVANATNVDLKLVDIERVEVLRGPQGTSFGSASLGGVVRTIPVAPKLDRFEGKVGAGYSSTADTGGENTSFHGIANLPLINDKLALRASAFRYDDSGFYRNRAGSQPNTVTQRAATLFGAQAFAVDEDDIGATRFTGGRAAALFQANDALKFTVNFLRQETEMDGYGASNAGNYDQSSLQVAPAHTVRGQRFDIFDTDLDLANAVVEYDLGWANLLGTYSNLESVATYTIAATFSRGQAQPMSIKSVSNHRGNIGEIRLATKLNGPWNFLGGVYVEDLDDVGVFYLQWHGSPETIRNAYPAATPGDTWLGESSTRRNLKQKAGFAEVSWEFVPSLTLTAGGRAYRYDRSELTASFGPAFGQVGPNAIDADASGTSYRGNLSYKPSENALVYASWSQGFRLGRAQNGLNPLTCDPNNDGLVDGTSITIESTRMVQSDQLDNYEIGSKFTLLDRRLTISADVFRLNWTDVPVTINVQSFGGIGVDQGCIPTYTANAGAARSEGAAFQTNFYVTDAFRVDLGGSWLRPELTKDVRTINAFKGNRLPGSPEYNANLGLQYEFNIGNSSAFVRADSIYVGSFHNNLQETPLSQAGGYVKVDVSGRVAIRNLNIDLFVHNLTNTDDLVAANGGSIVYGYRPRPRTIGVELGYSF